MFANVQLYLIRFIALTAATALSQAIAQTQYSIGTPSNEEQYMIELINRARANGGAEAARLGLSGLQEGNPNINGESWTIQNSVQPLSRNSLLFNSAQGHATNLNNGDQFFSGQNPHTYPNGTSSPQIRIAAANYSMANYNGPTTASGFFPGPENIAESETIGSGPFTGAKLITEILNDHNNLFTDQTVPGRGHRMTTMLAFFREIGIGISAGTDNGQGNTWDSLYVVQNFGTQTNSTPFITGVVYRDTNGNGFYDPGEGIGGVRIDVAGSNFFAVSSSSGGYSVPVPGNGSYNVTFSGGGQATAQRTVTVANSLNAKADYLATGAIVPSLLANISTRLRMQNGGDVLIGGMITQGTAGKKVIIRAIGPTLTDFGLPGALQDPTLEVFQGNTSVATNDDWRNSAQQAEIQNSGLAPAKDAESAIIVTLSPNQAYTAVVRGKNGQFGLAVVDAFDLDQAAASKLANISTRGFVGVDDNVMIAGVIVGPASGGSINVLVRALGPTLTNFGVAGALANPTVDLVNANGIVLRSNDDWKSDPSQMALIQAANLAPQFDAESALVQTIPPGAYTAVVRGAGRTTGVGLVEAYNIQ
ncbi:MAG TPA: hypothetical protein VJU77_16965 [Chthoniobacterales bacterium]|nr:hypothetical protein [Chthoniobacterales bacterium]